MSRGRWSACGGGPGRIGLASSSLRQMDVVGRPDKPLASRAIAVLCDPRQHAFSRRLPILTAHPIPRVCVVHRFCVADLADADPVCMPVLLQHAPLIPRAAKLNEREAVGRPVCAEYR